MKITTTITVAVVRPDGSVTEVTETAVRNAGDNPRFEGWEVDQALHLPTSSILEHWPSRPVPGNAVTR